ncbi:MAG: hypothetical protein LBH25_08000 [Fibromonadaceae bacterium]|jgi:hypothetical protein|nr:hypothetical protein [Fibromonadaceae bacterium]
MKKVLFVIFTVFLLQAGVLGCYEPPESPELEAFYVNNSGVTVKFIERDTVKIYPDSNYLRINEHEIKNNDTLCNYYLQENCSTSNWDALRGREGSEYIPAYFKIEFLIEPKICLIFDGNVKLENDVRYWENYTFIKKSIPLLRFYSYTITHEHREMAREEDCQSSANE